MLSMERRRPNRPYQIMMLFYMLFLIVAFVVDTPREIASGLWRIITSRSVLITDYMAVGGVGATLVNATIMGTFSIIVHMRVGVRPNGATIMAMWLTTAFALFGKNLFSMLPITFGVWLYSRLKKEPFMNYTLVFLLSGTCTPVVSGIAFHPMLPLHIGVPVGVLTGVLVGFLFPSISTFTNRIHSGYDLYNMGFAGGIISTFIVATLESVGLPMHNEHFLSEGNNLPLAILLYTISVILVVYGLFAKGHLEVPKYTRMRASSGRLVSDFLVQFGNMAYFNMGLLGIVATTLVLVCNAELNGPTVCAIFTVIGFGAFGKHLFNIVPLLAGALICTYISHWELTDASTMMAILFSTGLAPIAGQFGWGWGLLAGFLHVNAVMRIGFLSSGLNLYNNGYAAGFVAILLIPVIISFQRSKNRRERKGRTS